MKAFFPPLWCVLTKSSPVTFEEISFKDNFCDELSFEETSLEEISCEEISFKNIPLKEISFEDISFEEIPFKEISFILSKINCDQTRCFIQRV